MLSPAIRHEHLRLYFPACTLEPSLSTGRLAFLAPEGELSKYRQFLINEIKSAISCIGISFSSPSGMKDTPLLCRSSISSRRSVSDFPSCCLRVTDVEVSAARTPVCTRPSTVVAV